MTSENYEGRHQEANRDISPESDLKAHVQTELGDSEQLRSIKETIVELWNMLPNEAKIAVVVEQLGDILDEQQVATIQRFLSKKDMPSLDDKELGTNRSVMLPVSQVAKLTGYSAVRLRDLLKRGKIWGEIRPTEPAVTGWYTSIEIVEEYRASLPSPQEQGRRGAKKRWHTK